MTLSERLEINPRVNNRILILDVERLDGITSSTTGTGKTCRSGTSTTKQSSGNHAPPSCVRSGTTRMK